MFWLTSRGNFSSDSTFISSHIVPGSPFAGRRSSFLSHYLPFVDHFLHAIHTITSLCSGLTQAWARDLKPPVDRQSRAASSHDPSAGLRDTFGLVIPKSIRTDESLESSRAEVSCAALIHQSGRSVTRLMDLALASLRPFSSFLPLYRHHHPIPSASPASAHTAFTLLISTMIHASPLRLSLVETCSWERPTPARSLDPARPLDLFRSRQLLMLLALNNDGASPY
jgi:hypothetical protein